MRKSNLARFAWFLVIAAAAGCAPSRFPGTEIPDTRDTRAVIATLDAYHSALEKRDPAAILALAAPDYFDNGGTTDPDAALDRAGLAQRLRKDLASVRDLHVAFTLRRIEFSDSNRKAYAEVYFEQVYKVQTPNGLIPRRDADLHRFTLRRFGNKWLYVAGL